MALKRRNKVEAGFSLASMTDIIFLLLIFFMLISTVVHPSAIKITLPQSREKTTTTPRVKVLIDKDLNYYLAFGNDKENQVSFDEIEPFLQKFVMDEPGMYIALYADETIAYGEVVKILDIANRNKFKLVIATRPTENEKSGSPSDQ